MRRRDLQLSGIQRSGLLPDYGLRGFQLGPRELRGVWQRVPTRANVLWGQVRVPDGHAGPMRERVRGPLVGREQLRLVRQCVPRGPVLYRREVQLRWRISRRVRGRLHHVRNGQRELRLVRPRLRDRAVVLVRIVRVLWLDVRVSGRMLRHVHGRVSLRSMRHRMQDRRDVLARLLLLRERADLRRHVRSGQ